MEGYIGFLLGQALAIAFQWSHAKQEGKPWLDYWRNGAAARHLGDAILSLIVLTAWATGMVQSFAGLLGIEAIAAKLPETPSGFAALVVTGFAMAFVVRVVDSWMRKKTEPTP
jgi:purine-cytosine permease-like protein